MRQLKDTELFRYYYGSNGVQERTLRAKLDGNLGEITPEKIDEELLSLKNSSKNSYMPYLSDAVTMFEQYNGRVRLYNFGSSETGSTAMPPFIPFLPFRVRHRVNDGQELGRAGQTPAIVMNMFKIGHWNADETKYLGLSPKTDLYSSLETGVIMYKMLFENQQKDVFSNELILKRFAKIYTFLFSSALKKASGSHYGREPFQDDAANYLIAKFFLRYVLAKQDSETVDMIAYSTIDNYSTFSAIKSFEETAMINFDSLTEFLATFGEKFFNKKLSLILFDNAWTKMYGEGLCLAVEYAPFLLHFLFAAYHGAMLGGMSKLYLQINFLRNMGIRKLYDGIIAELK